MKIISYDIGGTFIKWAVIDEENKILEKGKFDTKANEIKAKGIFENVSKNAIKLNGKYPDANVIGISMPGVVSSKTGVVFSATHNIPESQGMDIKAEIAKYTNLKVFVINDANAATLGEKATGSLKDIETGVVVTLGTGIGGGIMVNGKIFQGHLYSSGEIGRHIVEGETWENQFSTKGLINKAKNYLEVNDISGEEIVKMIDENENIKNIYNQWLNGVGQGLANIINIINPEVISLSGGITENPIFKIEDLEVHISKYVLPEILERTKITKATSGNDSALYGVALFSREEIN